MASPVRSNNCYKSVKMLEQHLNEDTHADILSNSTHTQSCVHVWQKNVAHIESGSESESEITVYVLHGSEW